MVNVHIDGMNELTRLITQSPGSSIRADIPTNMVIPVDASKEGGNTQEDINLQHESRIDDLVDNKVNIGDNAGNLTIRAIGNLNLTNGSANIATMSFSNGNVDVAEGTLTVGGNAVLTGNIYQYPHELIVRNDASTPLWWCHAFVMLRSKQNSDTNATVATDLNNDIPFANLVNGLPASGSINVGGTVYPVLGVTVTTNTTGRAVIYYSDTTGTVKNVSYDNGPVTTQLKYIGV